MPPYTYLLWAHPSKLHATYRVFVTNHTYCSCYDEGVVPNTSFFVLLLSLLPSFVLRNVFLELPTTASLYKIDMLRCQNFNGKYSYVFSWQVGQFITKASVIILVVIVTNIIFIPYFYVCTDTYTYIHTYVAT